MIGACTIVHPWRGTAGRRVHRQRVHHPLSHPVVGGGARRRRPRHLEPDARQRRGSRRAGALAARRRRAGVRLDRGDGRGSSRSTASGSAARTSRASRTWSASSPRSRRARSSSASPARSRSAATPPKRARMVELVEEAGVLHGYLENQLFAPSLERGKQIVWARGAALGGPALPRARRRGARRPAHAVVLAGRSAGRRRAQRHDVPQPRGRPLPADQARRAARQHPPVKVSAQIASLKWSRPEYVEAAARHDDRRGRLRQASRRRLRARHGELRRRGRARR